MTLLPPFGAPYTAPRPRTAVDLEMLLEVVHHAVGHRAAADRVTIQVEDPDGPAPVIVLRDEERVTTIAAVELAARMSRDGVQPTVPALTTAFRSWVDHRPATDGEALRHGLATLAAAQPDVLLQWKVVVPRPSGSHVEWVPTWRTAPRLVSDIRAASLHRAEEQAVTPVSVGDVVVWVHLASPALSTAVLTQPAALRRRHPAADTCLVLAADRPVAVAGEGAAARLSEESAEEHVVVPLARLAPPDWRASSQDQR